MFYAKKKLHFNAKSKYLIPILLVFIASALFPPLYLPQSQNKLFIVGGNDSGSYINSDGGPRSSQLGIDYTHAPANLTGIAVDYDEYIIPAIKVNVDQFKSEWERVFKRNFTLYILKKDPSTNLYNYSEPKMFNATLVVGALKDIIGYLWPATECENVTVLTPWHNSTFGSGWALYAGSFHYLVQALSFYGNMLDRVERWDETRKIAPRFPLLLGSYRDFDDNAVSDPNQSIGEFENYLRSLVRRGFSALEMFVKYEKFANISLPGYSEPNHTSDYWRYISLLKRYFDLAANYSVKIFLNTDELSLSEAQYDWLMANLNYDGPAAKSDYPDHLSTNAPGLWTFWEAKYDAIVDSLQTILTPENHEGFGGFYFRTADQSGPYPYRFDILPTNNTAFQRFINITTQAAARLDALCIHRLWRMGEEENIFNNETLAKELLDPINATNLILRCKETWNDHWYNHPPNPVIGVSHHKWMIGWSMNAPMPDYKGMYYDSMFENGGWLNNSNIIGYDGDPIIWASFSRLDIAPFRSANSHYLFMKRWYPEYNGNQTLRKYFHQVGFRDENAIDKLIDVFNDVHEAFRQLTFWMGWSSSGKFTGDVLNNGNSILFSPGRFNMFYSAIQNTPYGNEYTIEEGFRGCGLAIKAYEEFPLSLENWGSIPRITEENRTYLDPEYASEDPENMTLQLAVLRGNVRQFADFAPIFANYRAWFIKFYEWGYTGNIKSFIEAESYRKSTMDAYYKYQEVWGNVTYWYKVNFYDMEKYWIPLVGNLDNMRLSYLGFMFLLIFGVISFIYSYSVGSSRNASEIFLGKLSDKLKLKRKTKIGKKSYKDGDNIDDVDAEAFRSAEKGSGDARNDIQYKSADLSANHRKKAIAYVLSILIYPIAVSSFIYGSFYIIAANLFPRLGLFAFELFLGLFIAWDIAVYLVYVHRKRKGSEGPSFIKFLNLLQNESLGFFGMAVGLVILGAVLLIGGITVFTASVFIDVILGLSLIIGLIWGILLYKNNTDLNKKEILTAFILSLVLFIIIMWLFTLDIGGLPGISENLSIDM